MFESMLDLLSLSLLPFGKVNGEDDDPEDDEVDPDDAEKDDDEKDDEDDEPDEDDPDGSDDPDEDDPAADEDLDEDKDEDKPKKKADKVEPKTYSEEVVRRLRTENKTRRLKNKKTQDTVKGLQQEISDLKSGRTADDKKKKSASNDRLEQEMEGLRSEISTITNERNELMEIQTQTDRVLVIGRIADEVGFAEPSDAVAFLSTKSDDFVDEDGEVDQDALRTELEELMERKPYLGSASVKERKDKANKGRSEASKTKNPPEEQDLKSQDIKKGKPKDEADIDKRIRHELNKNRDGKAALNIFLAEKYLPKTRTEEVTVS